MKPCPQVWRKSSNSGLTARDLEVSEGSEAWDSGKTTTIYGYQPPSCRTYLLRSNRFCASLLKFLWVIFMRPGFDSCATNFVSCGGLFHRQGSLVANAAPGGRKAALRSNPPRRHRVAGRLAAARRKVNGNRHLRLSAYRSTYLSVWLAACLPAFLPTFLSACPPVRLSAWLSVWLGAHTLLPRCV